MARPGGHPDIVELGRNTRYGSPKNDAAKASAKGNASQKQIKRVAEYLEDALAQETPSGVTIKEALAVALLKRAPNDMQAYALLLKLIGENPADRLEVTVPKTEKAEEVSHAVRMLAEDIARGNGTV